jgi:hypothetical protein
MDLTFWVILPPQKVVGKHRAFASIILGIPKSWKRHLGMLLDTPKDCVNIKMASQFVGPFALICARGHLWMIRPLGTSQSANLKLSILWMGQ